MTFTFPDGSIGVVDYLANGDKSMPKERLEVFCEGMIAVLDDYVSLTTGQRWKEERRENLAGQRPESRDDRLRRSHQEWGRTSHPLRTPHRRDQVHVCGGGVDTK